MHVSIPKGKATNHAGSDITSAVASGFNPQREGYKLGNKAASFMTSILFQSPKGRLQTVV
ncbi:hypothetical protein Calhy_2548 [Caldicellulosiruptor hydrothermalis 108]|uniref:Uncharacterized protein n=1 Tax=Caldicellulosiruptor hydrothermalis (strain DSM 18901 / VKM B-2411 / 108) TaxID=632292 RepID=E4QAD4_CALH1|nr:hypothetical protein Calhy_2548 [Caldicellulosiruptor hydrothermalis 108]